VTHHLDEVTDFRRPRLGSSGRRADLDFTGRPDHRTTLIHQLIGSELEAVHRPESVQGKDRRDAPSLTVENLRAGVLDGLKP